MKSYRLLACLTGIFALSLPPASVAAAVSTAAQNAEATSAKRNGAAASTAAASFAGEFAGDWLGDDNSGGTLKLTIKPGKVSAWMIEASFTLEGANVPTRTRTIQVDGSKIELVFEWELEGAPASSKLRGELKGDQLQGIYESTTPDGVEKGKWKVTRKPAGS